MSFGRSSESGTPPMRGMMYPSMWRRRSRACAFLTSGGFIRSMNSRKYVSTVGTSSSFATVSVPLHRPLEAVHAVGEDLEEAVDDQVPLFWIDLLAELHRALHVGEEYGHLLPLALEGAAAGENLLREVFRRVGARIWWWRRFYGLSEPLSAFSAELLSWLVLRFAGGADERELGAALGAEPSAGSILPATLQRIDSACRGQAGEPRRLLADNPFGPLLAREAKRRPAREGLTTIGLGVYS
jgi:hypothetical protein